MKRKEKADLLNESEQLIFATEKAIKDLGEKVSEADKTKAEAEMKDLKEALTSENVDDIKAKKEKLNETAMALATKVYEEAAKQQQEPSEEKKDDTVIDAEYEEK